MADALPSSSPLAKSVRDVLVDRRRWRQRPGTAATAARSAGNPGCGTGSSGRRRYPCRRSAGSWQTSCRMPPTSTPTPCAMIPSGPWKKQQRQHGGQREHEGAQRGDGELAVGVQDRHDQRAEGDQQDVVEHPAHQLRAPSATLDGSWKHGEHVHEDPRKREAEGDQRDSRTRSWNATSVRTSSRGRAAGAVLRDRGGKDGDERGGKGAFREELSQVVGDGEDGVHGVRGAGAAEIVVDQRLADVAEQPGGGRADHDDHRGQRSATGSPFPAAPAPAPRAIPRPEGEPSSSRPLKIG